MRQTDESLVVTVVRVSRSAHCGSHTAVVAIPQKRHCSRVTLQLVTQRLGGYAGGWHWVTLGG